MLTKLFDVSNAVLGVIKKEVKTDAFDYVPEKTPYPYIIVGEIETIEDSTKDSFGNTAVQTIQVWSKYPGKKESMEIGHEVVEALENGIKVEDVNIWEYRVKSTKTQEIVEGIYACEIKLEIKLDWGE